MRYSKQLERREEIERTALDLFIENGFRSSSMLAIAKRAKCSNETLYRWYGSKSELFSHVIKRYRAEIHKKLALVAHSESDCPVVPIGMGAALLEKILSQDGIALHRAIIVEQDGLGSEGRAERSRQQIIDEPIRSLFDKPIQVFLGKGESQSLKKEAVDTYLSLLIGDLPTRRSAGEHFVLTVQQRTRRAQRAMESTRRLFAMPIK